MKFEVQGQGRDKQCIKQTDPNNEFISYLDTLLSEIDETSKDVSNPKTKVDTANADTRIMGESIPATAIDDLLDSGLGKLDAAPSKQHAVYKMPRWAKAPFQVLMFEICGVKLGVPLVSLLGILELREAISRLPGQSVWQLGILTHRQQKIVVIDTANLIMPERVGPERVNLDLSGSYLLLIGEGEVGLLIDAINSTLMIDTRGVRWRLGSVQRPWLAGIIVERLSVLMDVDGLLGMIQKT